MGRIVGRKRATLKGKQQQQPGSADASPQPSETVHRRNVHLFAQPVILAFHVIRFVAFQLWLLLSLVYRFGSHVMATRTQSAETAQTGAVAAATDQDPETRRTSSSSTSSVVNMARPGPGSPARATGPSTGGGGYVVRPGAPVLAQQKHHHRKAFEYISKALKLDEDGKGSTAVHRFRLLLTFLSFPDDESILLYYLMALLFVRRTFLDHFHA